MGKQRKKISFEGTGYNWWIYVLLLYLGDNYWDFLFVSFTPSPLWKGVYSERKQSPPWGEKTS